VPGFADDSLDSTALIAALLARDTAGIESVLRFGCMQGIAMICATRLAVALAGLPEGERAAIIDGWRQGAEEYRWPPAAHTGQGGGA
jgi:hypothetical protein